MNEGNQRIGQAAGFRIKFLSQVISSCQNSERQISTFCEHRIDSVYDSGCLVQFLVNDWFSANKMKVNLEE